MSYDIYAYRPKLPTPELSEAEAAMEDSGDPNESAPSAEAERIAAALMQANPRLERFEYDYAQIAETQKITVEDARRKYHAIQLNPANLADASKSDLALQVEICSRTVFITFPYWYGEADAAKVFAQAHEYLQVIRKEAGYFAYDPQIERAFDPEKEFPSGQEVYSSIVKQMPQLLASARRNSKKKPWWKFW